ncbi:Pre-mRNA-processing-splicing factor 8 [Talaromyces islandicus]|uniref:Pre-mRNA-processing-splicing factor 8 n=1 Tax=Talaromyces islandicus TaxID=28573 RepID=A0A0U1LVQ1_TALIS|nr:Pre-mRNA-processing-splicing factor 8 [Talaromyces islandicus]
MSSFHPLSHLPLIRRLVTGHTSDSKSVFTHDDYINPVSPRAGLTTENEQSVPGFYLIHRTTNYPVEPQGPSNELSTENLARSKHAQGNIVCEIVDVPPVSVSSEKESVYMHRNQSLDYGVILKGSITLILDDGVEKTLSEGDVFVQRNASSQLSSIEDVDASDHREENGSQGESNRSKFMPKAVSQKLQKSSSQVPGNGGLADKNTPGGPGPSTDNFSVNPQRIISHEFLKNDPAFNPARLSGHKTPSTANVPRGSKLLHGDVKQATKGIARTVLHPRRKIIQHYQGKTAKSLSKATRPYLTPQADREFLAEYDALFEAEYSQASSSDQDQQRPNGTVFKNDSMENSMSREEGQIDENWIDDPSAIGVGRNYELRRKKVELLEAHRQSLAVAWITSRYIKRVRMAPWPMTQCLNFRDASFSETRGEDREARFRWENYIGELLLYFSRSFTARHVDEGASEISFDPVPLVERLVMSTEPWQAWLMSVRDLYRWETPRRTGCWYAVFAILWYTQHIIGFLVGRANFSHGLQSKAYEITDIKSMRESLDRVRGRSAQAHRCGELVDVYGRKKWIEPLIDEAAPFIHIQLGDLAAILEVLRNFYHWRNPSKTAATLVFFVSCLLVTLFASMEFCMKVFWFISINTFFLCWPIASRYPQYRYIVSPIRWVFWDIPSHPDWAIRFLQKHEILRRHEMCTHELSHGGYYSRKAAEQKESFEDAVERQEQRAEDELRDGKDSNSKYSTDMDSCTSSISFAVFRHGHQGHLIISSEGLSFIGKDHSLAALDPRKKRSNVIQELRWTYGFGCLAQMTKRHSPLSSKVAGIDSGLERLELEFLDSAIDDQTRTPSVRHQAITYGQIRGVRTRVETLDLNRAERDEVFNLIVGWNKTRWQVLSVPSGLTEKARAKKATRS